MSGNQEPKEVEITAQAYEQGVDALNDLVLEAMREAHAKSVEVRAGGAGDGDGCKSLGRQAARRSPAGRPWNSMLAQRRCVLWSWLL